MPSFGTIAKSLGSALKEIGTYSQNAAAKANAISGASQSAQGTFNQASADQANALNLGAMSNQYGFNSAQAEATNAYNTAAWERAAQWNEAMWQKQADFNAEQAQIQRDWQTKMANTSYQRAMKDMEKAGLNPILAYSQGGAQVPGGAVATSGNSAMGAASGVMATGGLLGANSASEGNYTGQMEQMGTTLALLGAIFAGISSAADAAGGLGSAGEQVMQTVSDTVFGETNGKKAYDIGSATYNKWQKETDKYGLSKGTWNTIKAAGKAGYNSFIKNNNSREFQFRSGHAKG